jgi:hypothetical protein
MILAAMGRPDYPKTMREFREQFSSRQACLEYLVESRWPEGFVCPTCGSNEAYFNSKRFRYECILCRKQTSPTAGTAMHRSKIPIQDWFWAAYMMATHTPGMSAKQLQRYLGTSSYETAWYLLSHARLCIARRRWNQSRHSFSILSRSPPAIATPA